VIADRIRANSFSLYLDTLVTPQLRVYKKPLDISPKHDNLTTMLAIRQIATDSMKGGERE